MTNDDPFRTPTIIMQTMVRFSVAPIVRGCMALFAWMVRNRWFFFSLLMGTVFVLDRMGVFADPNPAPVDAFLTTTVTVGWFTVMVANVFLWFIIVTLLLICYDVVRPGLLVLYIRIRQIGAAIALIGLSIYSKISGRFGEEFVVLEGQVTLTDLLKFVVIIIIFIGLVWTYVGFKQAQEDRITEMYLGNVTDVNGSIERDIQTNFTINLTTPKYGPKTVQVSTLIDRVVEPIIAKIGAI